MILSYFNYLQIANGLTNTKMTQIVQKALDRLRPNKQHRLYPPCFVSEDTRSCSQTLFGYLEQNLDDLGPTELEDIRKLIESARSEVFQVVDWHGFTLLQRAVIANHLSIVKYILKRGCDRNAGICSFPLHLACSLGHVHVAQLLLTSGAKADIGSTMCYPGLNHRLKTCPDQMYCLAYQSLFTPIMYALKGDHDQVLSLLLHHENSRQQVKTDYLLHESCKFGAHKCSKYLLNRYAEQMSQENSDGKTPLQISLITDAESAIVLRDNGAEIKNTAFLTDDGSTLHELYKSKVSLGLVKATKFALEHGFRSVINVRDQEGNTALCMLLRHVGRNVNNSIQVEFDREVEDCVKLLLVHGANPNIITRSGENAMHSLLTDTSGRHLYVSRHGQVMRLKPVLQQICKVAEILLEHGAHVGQNKSCPAFIPPLFYAIKIFYSLQPDMFVVVKNALIDLFILLCRDNLDISLADSYGKTPALHLITASFNMISRYKTNASLCKTILPFVGEMLQHFIKRGLDLNKQLEYYPDGRMHIRLETTYFKEIILLANLQVEPMEPQYYSNIKPLLVKLVQRGGNPNLLHFTPSYGERYTLTQDAPKEASFACLLARSLYIHDATTIKYALEVLDLLYQTLNQSKLTECIDSIQHYSRVDFSASPLPECVQQHLQDMRRTPRHLKELTRIAIAESVRWKLARKVAKLPLPKVLLHYCIRL